jgi:hypothetical protein
MILELSSARRTAPRASGKGVVDLEQRLSLASRQVLVFPDGGDDWRL